jgi:hypothetical protein
MAIIHNAPGGGPRRLSDEESTYCGTLFEREIGREDPGNKADPGRRARRTAPFAPARKMPTHKPEADNPPVTGTGEELDYQNVWSLLKLLLPWTIPQGWQVNGGVTRISTLIGISPTFRPD